LFFIYTQNEQNEMNNILPFEAFFEAKRQFNIDQLYKDDQEPLKDDDVVTVYHGFNNIADALGFAKFGFSGKERAKRIYSYEVGNNPNGLFVTIDLDKAKRFSGSSGIIMQCSVKVSDLEAPVWVGGRSYFVQGEYTKSFETPEEREEQRLANREKHRDHEMKMVAQSDRPELAQTLFENPEKQALLVGDINPNMIKGFWVNDKIKDRVWGGSYAFYPRKAFIAKYFSEDAITTTQSFASGWKKVVDDNYNTRSKKLFLPNEDFSVEVFKQRLYKSFLAKRKNIAGYDPELPEVVELMDDFMEEVKNPRGYHSFAKEYIHPKQMKQMQDLIEKGEL
jgi:hypothetical protein